MKSLFFRVLLTCVLMLGICAAVQAAEEVPLPTGNVQPLLERNHFGKDWSIMVGIKAWYNEWSLPLEFGAYDQTFILEYESDAAVSFIPAMLVRHRNFFVAGSYLLNTDYDFDNQQYITYYMNDNNQPIAVVRDLAVSGSRKEWDMNVGYFLTPNLAVSLGYKSLERDLSLTNSYAFDTSYFSKSIYPLSVHAPIVGISASAPVGKKFNLYGNLAYGWLSGDASYKGIDNDGLPFSNNFDLEGKYVFSEVGLNYIIPLQQKFASAISINAGYRFQRLDMNIDGHVRWGKSGDQHDATAGFVLGVSASL